MTTPVKYKRFQETHKADSIQFFLDSLIYDGWEIIYYNETEINSYQFKVTVIGVKKQNVNL